MLTDVSMILGSHAARALVLMCSTLYSSQSTSVHTWRFLGRSRWMRRKLRAPLTIVPGDLRVLVENQRQATSFSDDFKLGCSIHLSESNINL
jgi:hypothetical protein